MTPPPGPLSPAPASPCGGPAAPWVARFAGLVPAGGHVLDLACGDGRHARFFLARACRVTAVDIDLAGLADLAGSPRLRVIAADLEGGPWPVAGQLFDGVVVTNYLHRAILPAIVAAVAPGGALIYQTFAAGNERFGRPRNPDFLLRPGELLDAVRDRLEVVAYENLEIAAPKPALVQRIAAVSRGGAGGR